MKIDVIEKYLISENIDFKRNIDLKKKTRIKRGGIVSFWIQPIEISEFEDIVIWCQLKHISVEIIGNTSNCYFKNEYNPIIVISTIRLVGFEYLNNQIKCSCGYNISKLSRFCISNGIARYEGFIDLPGTVGAAAVNNSGCYGSIISDVLIGVYVLLNGKKQYLSNKQLRYSHRNSIIKEKLIDAVIVSVVFCTLKKENKLELEKKAKNFKLRRKNIIEQNSLSLGSTYCKLHFKKISFCLRCISFLIIKLFSFFCSSQRKRLILKHKLFMLLRDTKEFKYYTSKYGIASFVWRDDNADSAFIVYQNFIKHNTINNIIEIDIKE